MVEVLVGKRLIEVVISGVVRSKTSDDPSSRSAPSLLLVVVIEGEGVSSKIKFTFGLLSPLPPFTVVVVMVEAPRVVEVGS